MSSTPARSIHRISWARVALVIFLATLVLVVNVVDASDLDTSRVYVTQYRGTDSDVEKLLTQGDGQFFAALAQDPTMARPEAIDAGDVEGQFAYRAMRPAFGWLGWVVSAGQSQLVPWALIVLTLLSVGLLYVGVEQLALRLGRDPRIALLIIVLPGLIRQLGRTGPEIGASALACLAIVAAIDGRTRRTVVLLVGAVLLRETLVLVAAGLVLSRHLRLRWALVPPAALVAWLGIVYLRVGALPGGESRFAIGGLIDAADAWAVSDWAVVIPLVALMVLAAQRSPLGLALVLPHLALTVIMGEPTGVITSFVRILLPLYAILLPFVAPRVGESQHVDDPRLEWDAWLRQGTSEKVPLL